ncbi:CDP-diacylglycerol--glycerol-3-phosphate 3-phosphatidyltransferase [Tumebacillus permanentifrigoris]|uniref:CDP-diacylglycerol--glycerol-3-phosphate 3-phosphatidyltransferase n=1 Tax=Tumebacillus permanentifrigoris TaxID=378543 RepID=A0A316DBB5_9BACL|nr:CDP-diacylglycerol--glycerol-3-phosphate 3-phosphatidyltransferase [Tumebacillus permanentifrigoris]PWK15491.1 CDP-diacylglycerol--glycerol-3-phosphate 3-phosphatidyltransferase [Tumebacillus permanentifrigoris]
MKFNLANRITLARISLVPIVMFFLLVRLDLGKFTFFGHHTSVSDLIAALIFIIAAVTDGLDGYIARSRKMVTNFGKFLDPLADKLLISAILISLVEMGRLDAWVAIVIISREFAVTGLRLVAAANGTIIAASNLAKWKTTFQIIAVVLLILDNFPFYVFDFRFDLLMVYAMVFITVWSGVDYFVKNKQAIQEA